MLQDHTSNLRTMMYDKSTRIRVALESRNDVAATPVVELNTILLMLYDVNRQQPD
jgi:hypothetical protein